MAERGARQIDGGRATRRGRIDVLVVDDEESMRFTTASVLRRAGYAVEVAEDGEVALRKLESSDVGLVLLDLRMPRVDGIVLLDSLEAPPPVVVVSGFFHPEDTARLRDKVVAQLEKPIAPQLLLSTVAAVLGVAEGVP